MTPYILAHRRTCAPTIPKAKNAPMHTSIDASSRGATNVANLCDLRRLAKALPNKTFHVIETGYPYQPGGHAPADMHPYPQFGVSPAAELDWLRAVVYTVKYGLWGRGAGVCWWGTEYASRCSGDECAGFWDEKFTALPILTQRGFDTSKSKMPAGSVICPPL